MILDWTNISDSTLKEMAVTMTAHSIERALERGTMPLMQVRKEIENTINAVEDKIIATKNAKPGTEIIIKTKDGLNIVGDVIRGAAEPIFKVITLMWKRNFVPNNPNDTVIKLAEEVTSLEISLKPAEKEYPYSIHLPEGSLNQKKEDLLVQFIDYIYEELNLQESEHTEIGLFAKREVAGIPEATTAFYSPGNELIRVFIGGRAFADWLRSLAHELVHKGQFTKGDLLKVTAEGGLGCEQALEDEANFMAGRLVRAFGKVHPEIYNETLLQ